MESGHLSERCGLFIIIVIGEVILMTGATYASHAPDPLATLAFVASFVSALALWWVYFGATAELAGMRFAAAANVGAVARMAYTYFHVPIVGGVIAFAAGVELLIAHPDGHVTLSTAALLGGGPLLYIAGLTAFRLATGIGVPAIHWIALVALTVFVVCAIIWSPLVLATAIAATLIVVAAMDGRADISFLKGTADA